MMCFNVLWQHVIPWQLLIRYWPRRHWKICKRYILRSCISESTGIFANEFWHPFIFSKVPSKSKFASRLVWQWSRDTKKDFTFDKLVVPSAETKDKKPDLSSQNAFSYLLYIFDAKWNYWYWSNSFTQGAQNLLCVLWTHSLQLWKELLQLQIPHRPPSQENKVKAYICLNSDLRLLLVELLLRRKTHVSMIFSSMNTAFNSEGNVCNIVLSGIPWIRSLVRSLA